MNRHCQQRQMASISQRSCRISPSLGCSGTAYFLCLTSRMTMSSMYVPHLYDNLQSRLFQPQFEEFLCGLSVCCRSPMEQKLHCNQHIMRIHLPLPGPTDHCQSQPYNSLCTLVLTSPLTSVFHQMFDLDGDGIITAGELQSMLVS